MQSKYGKKSPNTDIVSYKYFLLLIQKHFSNNHKYHEISNKNNMEISNSCMVSIKSVINIQNKEVITEKKRQAIICNCMNKRGCSLSNHCQIINIIYKAKITSNLRKFHGKIYYGTNEGTFKQWYGNHQKWIMKNIGQIQIFRRNNGDLKNSKHNLKYNLTFWRDADQQK